MDKITKLKKAIAGEVLTDIPFSFWTHMPEIDREPDKIAQATYDMYQKFDLDFIKTLNNGMYATEDYGTEIDYADIPKGGVAKVVKSPIQTYDDWANLPKISLDSPTLQRELAYLEKLLALVDGEAPVIMTVFNPLTIADKLSKSLLIDHIKVDEKGYVHQALQHIAETTAELATKAIEMGAAGIYFATQMTSYDKVSGDVYAEYGVPYDKIALAGAEAGWFNAIHVHGENIIFDLVKDYPVQVFNWHIWESLPELKEGRDFTGKCVMGGMTRMDITHDNRNVLRHQIYRSIMETEGRHLILTPGCGIRHPFSEETIRFIQKVKQETEAVLFAENN